MSQNDLAKYPVLWWVFVLILLVNVRQLHRMQQLITDQHYIRVSLKCSSCAAQKQCFTEILHSQKQQPLLIQNVAREHIAVSENESTANTVWLITFGEAAITLGPVWPDVSAPQGV